MKFYISRKSYERSPVLCQPTKWKNEDLLQDLRDILTEARDFNDLNGICGVLYYADNAFFNV